MARITKYTSSNPQELGREIKSDRELRRIYNQRMSTAQRQVKKIEARYGERATTTNIQSLPAKAEGLTRAEMLKGISQANRYLKSGVSTLRGYKETLKAEYEGLKNYGLTVPKKDLIDVNYFLDKLRADGLAGQLPSDQIIDTARKAVKKNFDYSQLKGNVEHFIANPGARYLKANRRSSSDDY